MVETFVQFIFESCGDLSMAQEPIVRYRWNFISLFCNFVTLSFSYSRFRKYNRKLICSPKSCFTSMRQSFSDYSFVCVCKAEKKWSRNVGMFSAIAKVCFCHLFLRQRVANIQVCVCVWECVWWTSRTREDMCQCETFGEIHSTVGETVLWIGYNGYDNFVSSRQLLTHI